MSTSSSPQLEVIFESSLVGNGPTTTADGRLFLVCQPREEQQDPQVVEIRDGSPAPFPDERWNAPAAAGSDGSRRFVGVNSVRVGPDGALWVVDRGSAGVGSPQVPGGAKLIRIDLTTNSVERVFDLAGAVRPWSFIDDVRFHGRFAYLTDAGCPGLLVLDLEDGTVRRVLDGHPSVVAQTALTAEGKALRTPDGRPVSIHVDQLEVSPDGTWLYYQPCSGGMYRLGTRYLDDPELDAGHLASHVEWFADTPSTGGTAIDARGTIYLSAVDDHRILTIAVDGEIATLMADERLVWVDAMWIDDDGNLLMPAAQLNRSPGLNHGLDEVVEPLTIYRMPIAQQPVRR